MIVDWLVHLFVAEPVPRTQSSYQRVRDFGILGLRWYCVCGHVLPWRRKRCSCGARR